MYVIINGEFISLLQIAGESARTRWNICIPPTNIEDILLFFRKVKEGIETGDPLAVYVSLVLRNMVSNADVRKRKVTARVFEDILARIFSGTVLDESRRENPEVPPEIRELDKYSAGRDWSISTDLSSNKREKGDLLFINGDNRYVLSVKTQYGPLYECRVGVLGERVSVEVNSKANLELNAGSLSFRSLFVGIISDERLDSLRDRRGGLGSRRQVLPLYQEIFDRGMWESFSERLRVFLDYLYGDLDILIAFKEGERMTLHFIEGFAFVDALVAAANEGPSSLSQILHRWENNNIRLMLPPLFERLRESSGYNVVTLDFCRIPEDNEITRLVESEKENLRRELRRLLSSN